MGKCIICQKETFKNINVHPVSVYDRKPYGLLRCDNCQTLFTDPLPLQSELDQIYEESYFYGAHEITIGEKRYRARKIADFIGKYKEINKALDIGSMYGFLIQALKKNSIHCAGIEINSEAVEYCRKNNIPTEKMSLENFLEKPGETYDIIILNHVLEHLLDPKEKMLTLKNKLNNNGKVLVCVPNANARTRKIFGKFWGYWDVPAHITHFSKEALQYLLENSGYQIIETKSIGGSSLLFFSTVAKMLGKSGSSYKFTACRKKFVGFVSSILKYWYYFGDDEIIIVARKISSECL